MNDAIHRYRLTFGKRGAARYIGHLDLQLSFERLLTRAQVALAYRGGFKKRPRIQFAAPLPLGFIGEAELVDIWLRQAPEPSALLNVLQNAAPPDLPLCRVEPIALRDPGLSASVIAADYRVELAEQVGDLSSRLAELLAANELLRTRRNKPYDLRPLIEDCSYQRNQGALALRLGLRPARTGRPEEVLDALGLDPLEQRIIRCALVLDQRAEPAPQQAPESGPI
ncbi:MAG: DUF2344 domain-containing protein [Deltaproteobacteria bacterium]|nr:DUF2344 domain-containing protein [Deltaproteobacteria bacterium]